MENQEKQKLNKKLALWAGWRFVPLKPIGKFRNEVIGRWLAPDQVEVLIPNFTDSLDACVKWLVSKLHTWEIESDTLDKSKSFACVEYNIPNGTEGYDATAETPALAFCLAIEKVVEEDAKHKVD